MESDGGVKESTMKERRRKISLNLATITITTPKDL
jgi:hypothetical protein